MLVPAQLWVGPEQELFDSCIAYLQKKFCPYNGCKNCSTCEKIVQKQHSSILWLAPSKGYTRTDITPIFEKIVYSLDQDEQFFFIIPQAELLNSSSANSMLKTIEEPPQGYNFIFFAQRPSLVLPTITSRCILVSTAGDTKDNDHEQLLAFFREAKLSDAFECNKLLEKKQITDLVLYDFLDELLKYYTDILKKAFQDQSQSTIQKAQKKCIVIRNAYETFAMPGSGKYFLRNLFLTLCL
jgi:DNA polymerase III delta prime subunit